MQRILNNYWYIFLTFFVVSLIVFGNSIDNQFSLIDDYAGFVQNEQVKDINYTLNTYDIQKIVYSISYGMYGNSPIPLNALSILLHIFNGFMMYILFKDLYPKKVVFFSSLIFLVHPVVTEPVNWISGIPYLYITFITLVVLILFKFYRIKKNIKYILYSALVYALFLIYYRTIWMITIPLIIFVFDFFILGTEDIKDVLKKSGEFVLLALISIIAFYLESLENISNYINRLDTVTMNSQELIPVVETYPYTIYHMLRLYLFPVDLSFFYDGVPITQISYVLMYIVFLIFLISLVFLFRYKKYFGLKLLMIISILPSFFPGIYVWTIAERYLYRGTIFFSILIVSLIFYLEEKAKVKYMSLALFICILLIFSFRTYQRNKDWDSPKSFAYASVEDSPLSPRPHSDLGALAIIENDFDTALKHLEKSLEILPGYENAVTNTGIVHLLKGEVTIEKKESPSDEEKRKSEVYFDYAIENLDSKKPVAVYYLVRSLELSNNEDAASELEKIIKVTFK